MDIFEKATQYMNESGIAKLIESSDAVLVAFSGGADSSVLLLLLKEYLKDKNVRLGAAHLNHMIRGEEAERDQEFCRDMCKKLDIEFYTKYSPVPQIAKEKNMTLEEAARNERYDFLWDTAGSMGKNTLIATAHNATDNMETVIFNLARGSGTTGIGGIAPIRDNKIIRPILCLCSEEIRDYANKNGIDFVFDSTNTDTVYTRNFVRHRIVPLLREINPSADDAVLRLSKIARKESDYITEEAEKLTENGYIKRTDFETAHPALRERAIRALYIRHKGSADGLSMKNLETAARFSLEGRGRLSLPSSMTLFSDTDRIYFGEENEAEVSETVELAPDGVVRHFGENFAIALCAKGKEPVYNINIYNLFIQQNISFDTIYGSIFVRCRKSGDRIFSGGMHKKVKKLMCDKNVPLRYRNELPLFCDEKGILWVPSVQLRDGPRGEDLIMYVFTVKG